jgi:hypothetical protein
MPTPTYDLIASNVLTSSAASVTFSSLPSTGYRDLIVVASVRGTAPGGWAIMRANSDSGSNYFYVSMAGNGSSAFSNAPAAQTAFQLGASWGLSTTQFLPFRVNIFDYAQTDKHKTVLARLDDASFVTEANAQRWASTSAITSLVISATSGNFDTNSSFYIYGISA